MGVFDLAVRQVVVLFPLQRRHLGFGEYDAALSTCFSRAAAAA